MKKLIAVNNDCSPLSAGDILHCINPNRPHIHNKYVIADKTDEKWQDNVLSAGWFKVDLYIVDDDSDVYINEWCFELHSDYETSLIRFKDEYDPSMAWFLRELNMNYSNDENLEWRKTKDGTCIKILATTNPDLSLPIIQNIEECFELINQKIEIEYKSSNDNPFDDIAIIRKIAKSEITYTEEEVWDYICKYYEYSEYMKLNKYAFSIREWFNENKKK